MELASAFEDSQPFRLTVDHYRALDESGAFDDGPRVELIEGMIVCMSPMSFFHGVIATQLLIRLDARLKEVRSSLIAVSGVTVSLPPHNLPDPDIIVAKRQPDGKYFSSDEAQLLIEVSRTTPGKDLSVKRDV